MNRFSNVEGLVRWCAPIFMGAHSKARPDALALLDGFFLQTGAERRSTTRPDGATENAINQKFNLFFQKPIR